LGKAYGEKTESATQLALLLLVRFEERIASQLLLLRYYGRKYYWKPPNDKRFMPKGFTGLHREAFYGIGEIVPVLLATKEWSINERDNMGRTALLWGAIKGHDDVVGNYYCWRISIPMPKTLNMVEQHSGWLRRAGVSE